MKSKVQLNRIMRQWLKKQLRTEILKIILEYVIFWVGRWYKMFSPRVLTKSSWKMFVMNFKKLLKHRI